MILRNRGFKLWIFTQYASSSAQRASMIFPCGSHITPAFHRNPMSSSNSLGNQIQYYEDLIRRNSAWTFVSGYIDEGLSGISTKKRENFNRMLEEAAEDRFDLIITKEISRFARNTLDSIQYTRQLLSYGIGVFFQNRQHQHLG